MPWNHAPPQGDRKRIDFRALGHDIEIAMEVKWAKAAKINIKGDQEKLQAFLKARPQAFAFLCVFGRK